VTIGGIKPLIKIKRTAGRNVVVEDGGASLFK